MKIKSLPLFLVALLSACGTTVWIEETDQTRPAGEVDVWQGRVPIAEAWFRAYTQTEADGFFISENFVTDRHGRHVLNLLPVALQCLGYRGEVTLTIEDGDGKTVHRTQVTETDARGVIDEWHVRTRLGARPELRQSEIALMDGLIEISGDRPLVEQLREIRDKVTLRPVWR